MRSLGLLCVGKKVITGFLLCITVVELLGSSLLLSLIVPFKVEAAEVTVAATPNTTAVVHTQLGSSMVFIDDKVGYKFYRYGASPYSGMCGYSTTTDGGATWGNFVPTDTQTDCIGVQVWYDQWTPGDTSGTYIHIVTIDTTDDEMFYNRLDTTNRSLLATTSISACLGCAGAYGTGLNLPSITKSTTGLVYMSTDDGNGTNIRRCSSNCGVSASWTAVGTPPQGNADSYSLLLPRPAGDVMLINRSTTNVLRFSMWTGTSWGTFSTIDGAAIQHTTYDVGMAATVDVNSGDIYLAYVADNNDFITADHDIRTRFYNGSWSSKTDVLTNVSGRGLLQVAIGRDQNNGDIYVAYTARSTIGTATTANVYMKRSTDGMTSWGSEVGPYSSSSGDYYGVTMNLMSFERLYVTWFNATIGDIFGDTIVDTGPQVELKPNGTQLAQTRSNTSNVYVGGSFALVARNNYTVSSVVVAETGSVNAQTGLKNVKLFYENDTSAPYNCASESYGGSENQFGATAAAFSGANGFASFTNSPLAISTTSTLCFYTVFDVDASTQDSQTIEISVANPKTDVIVSGGVEVYPATEIAISGTTTIVAANPDQFGFHWRLDNGNEVTASSATAGTENTALSALQVGAGRRVRVGVSTQGSTSTLSSAYTLQYGEAAPTCEGISNWIGVGASGAAWRMLDSANLTEGNNTTNVSTAYGGLTDPGGKTFITANSGVKDTLATTSSLIISTSQFVEFEYSIVASSTAVQGATYCFRLVQGGTPLSTYSHYPRATIASDVTVQSFGTHQATTSVATANVYSGGGFRIIENVGSRTVTGITITESGTVNGALGLDNIKLFYELDTSAPYDCVSEIYNGSETQFGTTESGGFSAENGSATFNDSVVITTTATLCAYPVFDVTGTAANDETIRLSINSPTNDVQVDTGSVGPSTPSLITGSTTIQGPLLVQLAYHWRNDNGTQATATSATGGAENIPVTELALDTPIRLRLAVTNTGLATGVPTRFRLEYAPKITTCNVATVWTDVNAAADGWDMFNSTFLTNGETTTDIAIANGGVSNGSGSFISANGGVRDTESQSGTTTIPVGNYLDLEYSITSTDFTSYGTTFCFRVTALGTPLATYTEYAEITTAPKRDFKIQRGSTQVSGTSTTILAGTNYVAPASTSRAFVRITNSHHTGAGHTVSGAQNADDVSVFISNPGNLATGFTLARPTAANNTTRVDWEIIEFIGQPGTDNEIVVRQVNTINFNTTAVVATGTAVSSVEDDTNIVVFITGLQNQNTSRNYYAGLVTSEWNAATDQPVFRRGANGASAVNASYAVVEFRGVNWNIQRVQHSYTASGVIETEAITAVNSLARTFLHTQKRMGATTNVVHFGHEVWLSSIGAVSFQLESGASVLVEQTSVAWIIENSQTGLGAMNVQRSSGNTTGGVAPLALSISFPTPVSALNNTSLMANTRAAGGNTNYPRPLAGFTLTSTTTYQIWRSDTGSLLTYRTEIIEWPVADLSLKQNYYRFYVHNDLLKPTDPWPVGPLNLGENTAITASDEPLGVGDKLRIRLTVKTANANMPAGFTNFKLQYGLRATTCSALNPGSWFDVGATASSTIWRGFSSTSTVDGTALSTDPLTPGDLLISVAEVGGVAGSLTHGNLSVANPYPVLDGDNIEYDWHLEHNGAIPFSTYCFRMVRGDGTPLEGYNFYPQIRTAGFTPLTRNWRWYSDQENETPATALANENVAPVNIANTDTLALRVSVYEKRNVQGNDVKFKLQFSDDITFANPIDVVATTSCGPQSLWCYEQGGGIDNTLISTNLLSDVESCVGGVGNGCGRHNVSASPASGHVHYGHDTQEYSFTIKNAAARVKAVYYFRLYDVSHDAPVSADSGESMVSLVTEGPLLVLSLNGLASGTTTAGVTTNINTTATEISFGTLAFDEEFIAAHRITVTTNSTEGYQLLKFARQPLTSSHGIPIPPVSGTNESPTGWSIGCQASSTGCVGYHTTDATLRGGSTRFAPNDTYAGLGMVPVEVGYSSLPTTDTHDIVYRIRVGVLQPAGQYETELVYIAVPVY